MGNERIKQIGAQFTMVPDLLVGDPNISFRPKVYIFLRSKPAN